MRHDWPVEPLAPRVAAPRKRHGERGQAVVEIALVLPILLLIAMIGVAGAQLLEESIVIRNAAREGALAAANYMETSSPLPVGCSGGGSSITNAQDCARYRALAAGAPSTVTVTWTSTTGSQSGLTLAQVTVSDVLHPAGSFFGARTISYTAYAAEPGQ